MARYRNNPAAVAALVRDAEVHRDVYIDNEIFELEMENLFATTWVYVGHESQIPNSGDYFTTMIGNQPILMVRHTDQTIKVLYNRCPHKGTKIAIDGCGNAGKFFRCPYHAWTFKTDGSLLSIPLKKGYENTGFEGTEAAKGLTPAATRSRPVNAATTPGVARAAARSIEPIRACAMEERTNTR